MDTEEIKALEELKSDIEQSYSGDYFLLGRDHTNYLLWLIDTEITRKKKPCRFCDESWYKDFPNDERRFCHICGRQLLYDI